MYTQSGNFAIESRSRYRRRKSVSIYSAIHRCGVYTCVDFSAHPVYARGWVVSIEHEASVASTVLYAGISLYLGISMESRRRPSFSNDKHCSGRKRGVSVQFHRCALKRAPGSAPAASAVISNFARSQA